jgi:hypothetical protein
VEPSLIDINELYSSGVDYIYFYITNHGLITAESGRLELPQDLPSMQLIPEIEPVGNVPGIPTSYNAY